MIALLHLQVLHIDAGLAAFLDRLGVTGQWHHFYKSSLIGTAMMSVSIEAC